MRRALPLLAVMALGFAPAPPPRDTPKADLARLQGEWVRSSRSIGDEMREDGAFRMRIAGGRLSYSRGRADLGSWGFRLGRDGGVRTIDKEAVGENGRRYHWRGTYKLEGDTLTVCWTAYCGDKNRPRDFTPTDDVEVQVYHRVRR